MNTRHKHILSLLRRAQTFLATVDTPADRLATPLKDLASTIAELEAFGTRQEEHHRKMLALTTRAREAARAVRADHLRSVALAARAALPQEHPDAIALEQSVRLPKYGADYEQIVLAARGVAAAAEPHQDQLRAAGLGAEFLTSLRAAADVLVAVVGERSQALQRRVAATKGVESAVKRGLAQLRLLDVLARPVLRLEAPRLAEWERVIRRTRSAGGATPVEVIPAEVAAPGGESTRAA